MHARADLQEQRRLKSLLCIIGAITCSDDLFSAATLPCVWPLGCYCIAAALLTSPNSVIGCPNSLSLRMTSSLGNSSSCERTLSILCSCCACSPDFCLFLSSCMGVFKVTLRW